MTETTPIRVLISELERGLGVLGRIEGFYRDYLQRHDDAAARLTEQAIVITDTLAGWYTRIETVFLRISRFFENDLAGERWHHDLLEKMRLDLPGIREPVIAEETAGLLAELLRFRHFKRYYFDLDYDWDRIGFAQKKYAQAQPLVRRDLDRFLGFLRRLVAADGAA